jgi:histidyl-tRNA synthetase
MNIPEEVIFTDTPKSPWEEVRREMTEEKGLDPAVADKIGEYVKSEADIPIGANCRERSLKILESLEGNEALLGNELAKQGIKDLRLLFDYLDIWNCTQYVSYDMSLARGLDYYTGPIWEVVTEGSKPKTMEKEAAKPSKKKSANADDVEDRSNDPSVGIGSIAAGGRYDELVGKS